MLVYKEALEPRVPDYIHSLRSFAKMRQLFFELAWPWKMIKFHPNMKRQKNMTLKDELPRLVGVQYATGEEWRNNSKKNKDVEPKWKQCPVVDVTDDDWSKVWCCKKQYCIRAWNVRSMTQGKLDVVKQEMARVNIDILEISELKWTGMGEFNSNNHYI